MCAAKSKERQVDHLLSQQYLDDLDDLDKLNLSVINEPKLKKLGDKIIALNNQLTELNNTQTKVDTDRFLLGHSVLSKQGTVSDLSREIIGQLRRERDTKYQNNRTQLERELAIKKQEFESLGGNYTLLLLGQLKFQYRNKTKTKKSKAKKSKSRTKKSKTKKSNLKKSQSKNKIKK